MEHRAESLPRRLGTALAAKILSTPTNATYRRRKCVKLLGLPLWSLALTASVAPTVIAADLAVSLSHPTGQYFVGDKLRATITLPRAGYLYCALSSPNFGAEVVTPVMDGRPSYYSSRVPALIPDNNDYGKHPSIRLTSTGRHVLYCTETELDISSAIASLRNTLASSHSKPSIGW